MPMKIEKEKAPWPPKIVMQMSASEVGTFVAGVAKVCNSKGSYEQLEKMVTGLILDAYNAGKDSRL